MPIFWFLYRPFGFILQAVAIIHFIRRRPDGFWLWIIIFGGWIGALVYIVAEVLPDLGLLRGSFRVFGRRRRISELENTILDNPSPGNLEELGDLYFDNGNYVRARELFDRAIQARTDSLDVFYRRGLCAFELGDLPATRADLEKVVAADRKYDYHRAAGILAHVYDRLGDEQRAAALFAEVTQISTLSETQYHYAQFLARHGQPGEARDWASRILAKKRTMPNYLRRRERPWFRRAAALLHQLPS